MKRTRNFGGLAAALLAAVVQQATAGPAVAYTASDGREWRQVTATQGLDFLAVHAACSGSAGSCVGSVGGVLLEGWNFASNLDVYQLFVQASVPMAGTPAVGSGMATSPNDSAWASSFIDADGNGPDTGYFDATATHATGAWVSGLVRDMPTDSNYRYFASIRDSFDVAGGSAVDSAVTAWPIHRFGVGADVGYWLYREAAVASDNTLPLPGTLPLAGLSLACLAALRRRGR